MKIGLVCPYSFDRPGGVQNHVLGLAEHLRAHGHTPAILAPGELDLTDPLQVRLADVFTSAGAALPVPYNGSIARVNFGPVSAGRVRRWLRREDVDLLHIHEPITPSVAVLALWAAEVPVVATFHTATPRSRTMQLAGATMRATVEKIDAGIAVSESARRVVVQHLGRDAVVVPNGFSHSEFDVPVRPSGSGGEWRGGDRPRITFLGRVDEPRKGLDVLLSALPTVREHVGKIDVVVAGQGRRRLPVGVRALGTLSHAEKTALLRSTDVFVAPHLARESFGIVLLEAMASGAAVVASDLPAFTDLLQTPHGTMGRTFAVGDFKALASTLVATLRDLDLVTTERARVDSRRFDWSRVGADVLEVYRAAMLSSKRGLVASTTAPDCRSARTWAALDAALVRRARRAQELATDPRLEPAVAVAITAAATDALAPDLDADERERRESALSAALSLSSPSEGDLEHRRAVLARRLHNDAVTTAKGLRSRRTFEIADFTRATPTCRELSPEPTRVTVVSGEPHATR